MSNYAHAASRGGWGGVISLVARSFGRKHSLGRIVLIVVASSVYLIVFGRARARSTANTVARLTRTQRRFGVCCDESDVRGFLVVFSAPRRTFTSPTEPRRGAFPANVHPKSSASHRCSTPSPIVRCYRAAVLALVLATPCFWAWDDWKRSQQELVGGMKPVRHRRRLSCFECRSSSS